MVNWLKQNKDKIEHGIVSCGIYFIVLHLFRNVFLAILLALLVGVLKEVTDKVWDWNDLLADIIGIGIGILLAVI